MIKNEWKEEKNVDVKKLRHSPPPFLFDKYKAWSQIFHYFFSWICRRRESFIWAFIELSFSILESRKMFINETTSLQTCLLTYIHRWNEKNETPDIFANFMSCFRVHRSGSWFWPNLEEQHWWHYWRRLISMEKLWS